MFNRTRRGLRLSRQSLSLFKSDLKLLIFPIIGRGSYLLVMAGITIWLWYLNKHAVNIAALPHHTVFKLYVILLTALFFSNIIAAFMAAALAVCITEYQAGLKATFGEGLRAAKTRWKTLLMWILISITLGPLMRFAGKSMREFDRCKALVNGLHWRSATYFVVPIIMYHPDSALVAIHESSRMMLDYAGIRARANYSLRLPILLLRIIALIPLWIASHYHALHIVAAISCSSVFLFSIVSILNTCIHNTIRGALYQYIKTGQVPISFVEEDLANAIRRSVAIKSDAKRE